MRKVFTFKLFATVFTLIALAGCTGTETLPTQPGTYMNDLWQYGGGTWSQPVTDPINFPPPSARRDHTAVADSTKMYIFGGFNGTYLNDLWTFTFGGDWAKIDPVAGDTPPSGRRGHSAVWYSGKMYIFGGFNGTLLNDLWEYSPADNTDPWKQISPPANAQQPPYRRYHSAIVYLNKMYIFGGDNGAYQNELWEYDFDLKSWTQKAPNGDLPARRNGHSAVVDGSGKMYIFGGGTFNGVLNDIWVYDLINTNTWTPQSPTSTLPTARGVHSAVMLSGQMVVFGGYYTAALDETWQYNLTDTWTPKSSGPPARYAHSAVVSGTTMYIFGGYGPPLQ